MRKINVVFAVLFAALLAASAASAEIRVVSVKGTAAYKTGQQWTPLRAGAALAVGTRVSTGVRSTVELRINRHTVTVQPLTIMKVTESVERPNSSTTNIGLRRGSVRTRVGSDARVKTVFKVSTPVATSSVRGTDQVVVYSPTFGMRVIVLSGVVEGSGLNSAGKLISGDLQFWQKYASPVPESLMTGMEDFLTQTGSLFVTLDEETAFGLFGEDFLNYDMGGGTGQGGAQNAPVPVNIYLVWPSAE
ncbi:MAG: FecR domain-containing protein [Spirochaetes bacterium]|nr:FecR domain-containing protein [Spirochaetota bacterium]